jgi:hypothetical protein
MDVPGPPLPEGCAKKDEPPLSVRWQTASRELVDMVFAQILLTPLQIIALEQDETDHAAPDIQNWKIVLNILRLSKGTRKTALNALRLHGLLKQVSRRDAVRMSSIPVRFLPHSVLRHFSRVCAKQEFDDHLNGHRHRGTSTYYFDLQKPLEMTRPVRVEIKSNINPCEYSDSAKAKLARSPTSEDARSAAEKEDLKLVTFVVRIGCYVIGGRVIPSTEKKDSWPSAREVREMVVWTRS